MMDDSDRTPPARSGERRLTARVRGPFDGLWQGALTIPLKIHDLSVGGCLIESFHDTRPTRRMTLKLHLPQEGWITIEAEPIYTRSDYGFAVKFVDVPDATRRAVERVIERLLGTSPVE